jgi:penicillin-binding protein 2
VLALRLWSLQVVRGPHFALAAQQQTFRLIDLPAPRGQIVAANGNVLAGTRGGLGVSVDTAVLGIIDQHGRWWPTHQGRMLLRRLGSLASVSPRLMIQRIRHSEFKSPYSAAVVLPRVSRDLSYFLDEHARQFPGIRVVPQPERSYPSGSLGSEFLGLLGEVSPNQLAKHVYRGARAGMIVGQSGVEATYDHLLNGGLEKARVVVDAQGRAIGPAHVVRVPRPARGLQLTIDPRLQRVAEKAIQDGIALAHGNGHYDAHAGAAVVMNPWSGAVYALASYPRFDERKAATDPEYLRALLNPNDPRHLLVNRATQGQYPTGSTFKPIVAEAGLASGLLGPYSTLQCTGSYTVGGHVFHNVESNVNATLTLPEALSVSCDTWFYRLGSLFYSAQEKGHLYMQNWARRLGIEPTGFDVPGESPGLIPTPGWLKRTAKYPWQRIWYEGYSVNLAVGQGQLQVTPLQLAVAYSTLANGGTVVRPHVGKAILNASGQVIRNIRYAPRRHVHLYDVGEIRDGLYSGAHSGTSAAVFGTFPIPVAGKTGTAETCNGCSDHSWYASWAPAYSPKLVVVVMIEHGGFGAEAAAPAAKEIYSAYFGLNRKQKSKP